MNNTENQNTGTSGEVLSYYARNWEKIAKCYELDSSGLPVDPAWYRRRLYNNFLRSAKPRSVLDIGCGGGWTVLDALKSGVNARGIEPVAELQRFGVELLAQNGYPRSSITQENLSSLRDMPDGLEECVALLSVLPHVPDKDWDHVHANISRVLKPGGKLFAAYRNTLFDLYTFNSLTLQFYDKVLWDAEHMQDFESEDALVNLKELIKNPDLPGPYHTMAVDKSFGELRRVKSNPLTIGKYLAPFGLTLDRVHFYHYHCAPPLIMQKLTRHKQINHVMELKLSDDWRGHFMCAMFLVEVTKT
jgi:SAM-dependent methyltransferase